MARHKKIERRKELDRRRRRRRKRLKQRIKEAWKVHFPYFSYDKYSKKVEDIFNEAMRKEIKKNDLQSYIMGRLSED